MPGIDQLKSDAFSGWPHKLRHFSLKYLRERSQSVSAYEDSRNITEDRNCHPADHGFLDLNYSLLKIG